MIIHQYRASTVECRQHHDWRRLNRIVWLDPNGGSQRLKRLDNRVATRGGRFDIGRHVVLGSQSLRVGGRDSALVGRRVDFISNKNRSRNDTVREILLRG